MKKLLLGTAALVALVAGGSAMAADQRVKAPVYKAAPPVAAYDWTGFYVGGHVGYGWAKPGVSDPITGAPLVSPLPSPKGFLGGVQAGVNYQFITGWVIGVEADFTWTNVKGSANCVVLSCAPGGLELFGYPDQHATLAARIGYDFNRLLAYVKAGGAWVHEDFRQTALTAGARCTVPCTASNTGTGWMVGGGLEYAWTRNWSVKVEYSYMSFDTKVLTDVTNGVEHNIFNETRVLQDVKLGLNYRFDWGPSPVVAKY
jgi:outer membrane immunogenic protein